MPVTIILLIVVIVLILLAMVTEDGGITTAAVILLIILFAVVFLSDSDTEEAPTETVVTALSEHYEVPESWVTINGSVCVSNDEHDCLTWRFDYEVRDEQKLVGEGTIDCGVDSCLRPEED